MPSTGSEYLALHASQIAWGAGFFGVSLACSAAAVLFILLRLPHHYFDSTHPEPFWPDRPPWQRRVGRALKNLAGFVLVALGLVMSLPGVPGQGLLTVFVGIVVMDFPGKRAIERRIIAVPAILRGCNRLRARFGKPPLTLGEGSESNERAGFPDDVIHGRTK